MVAAYEILPTSDPERAGDPRDAPWRSSVLHRFKSVWDTLSGAFRAHADALESAWLAELDRLGAPVFAFFMLLRLGLLSLSIFWGFLLVSPFWCLSLVSNERFLPSALQTGLVVSLIIIIEPLPFVGLMHDARAKLFHVLYGAYLILGWREICVYLVREEPLGMFVARVWVRDLCFTVAGAAFLGCGALGWTIWEELPKRLWALYTVFSLFILQTVHRKFRTDV